RKLRSSGPALSSGWTPAIGRSGSPRTSPPPPAAFSEGGKRGTRSVLRRLLPGLRLLRRAGGGSRRGFVHLVELGDEVLADVDPRGAEVHDPAVQDQGVALLLPVGLERLEQHILETSLHLAELVLHLLGRVLVQTLELRLLGGDVLLDLVD